MLNRIKKGFTIVELVIVIAVIAILAGVLIPTFSGVVSKANESAALQTAKNTLDNALLMSSTASLAGKNDADHWRTEFLVNGYAFGYNGNSLQAINYPGYDGKNYNDANSRLYSLTVAGATALESKDAFNAILISTLNLKETTTGDTNPVTTYTLTGEVGTIISNVTSTSSLTVTKVNGDYFINYVSASDYFAKLYVNSDFVKDVVVFTTFGK